MKQMKKKKKQPARFWVVHPVGSGRLFASEMGAIKEAEAIVTSSSSRVYVAKVLKVVSLVQPQTKVNSL